MSAVSFDKTNKDNTIEYQEVNVVDLINEMEVRMLAIKELLESVDRDLEELMSRSRT